MKAVFNGQTIAESDAIRKVEGNAYFPPESLRREFFRESGTHTTCPWKGVASYMTVAVEGKEAKDAAWFYPEPKAAAQEIAGLLRVLERRRSGRRRGRISCHSDKDERKSRVPTSASSFSRPPFFPPGTLKGPSYESGRRDDPRRRPLRAVRRLLRGTARHVRAHPRLPARARRAAHRALPGEVRVRHAGLPQDPGEGPRARADRAGHPVRSRARAGGHGAEPDEGGRSLRHRHRQGAPPADADDHRRGGRGRVLAHQDRRGERGVVPREGHPLRGARQVGVRRQAAGHRRRGRLRLRLGAGPHGHGGRHAPRPSTRRVQGARGQHRAGQEPRASA